MEAKDALTVSWSSSCIMVPFLSLLLLSVHKTHNTKWTCLAFYLQYDTFKEKHKLADSSSSRFHCRIKTNLGNQPLVTLYFRDGTTTSRLLESAHLVALFLDFSFMWTFHLHLQYLVCFYLVAASCFTLIIILYNLVNRTLLRQRACSPVCI